jgi:mannose-1-phosphate guanylyltransferase/mannose-1-phosphate guanylyltransferase/phosphomannomutase
MDKAFVLGAGLGTRLRPLTDQYPKPLIPFFHRPLITRAFDHLRSVGVHEFVVNTHHLPECYAVAFPTGAHEGCPITFRHEPVLLETAGGIANVADLLGGGPFLVYNGDILSDVPLAPLLRAHQERGNLVTLLLRTEGPARHVAFDAEGGAVTDIRGKLGTGNTGTHQFTGIYAVSPAFLELLTPGKIESVVNPWLKAIRQGQRIGAVVVDEGRWWDLGDRESYLDAHRAFLSESEQPVSPEARIAEAVRLRGLSVIGPGAEVGSGAMLEDCILWPGARVEREARLRRCIVRRGMVARGALENADV